MAKRVAVLVLLVSVAGCGGAAGNSPPPAKAATEAKEAPAEKPAESSAKADFMAQCEHAPEQHDFCACSFEVASKVLSPEELESRRLPRERERELKAGVIRECAGKFPEPVIKKGFMVGCASQGTGLNGFCACTWETLRKSAEPGEIATMDAGQDSRALGAAKTCMAKMPNQTALRDHRSATSEGRPATPPDMVSPDENRRAAPSLNPVASFTLSPIGLLPRKASNGNSRPIKTSMPIIVPLKPSAGTSATGRTKSRTTPPNDSAATFTPNQRAAFFASPTSVAAMEATAPDAAPTSEESARMPT